MNGQRYIVAMNMGTDATPDYQPVGEQSSASLESSREEIDGSFKTNDHQVTSYGRKSDSLSLESMMPDPDAGAYATYDSLLDALNNKQELVIRSQLEKADGTLIEKDAAAKITTISSEYPDNDNATFSAQFTLQEAFTAVA